MPELVIVLVVLGVLAAVVVPKLDSAMSFQREAWRDQVLSALTHARSTAVAHRRLVCATVAAGSVTLTMAPANPATSCSASVPSPSGAAAFASTGDTGVNTSVSPAGVIYFQPDGRITTDAAGTTPATRTVSMTGLADITLYGETGHVE